jgi:hypothetical protein
MTLLHIDGFDAKSANLAGMYSFPDPASRFTYVAGRTSGWAVYSTSPTDTAGSYAIQRTVPSSTTLITGFAIYPTQVSTMGSAQTALSLRNGSTDAIWLRYDSGSGIITIQNGSNTTLGTTGTPVPPNSWSYLELKAVASTGSSGSVELRMNGNSTLLSVSGLNTGAISYDGVVLRGLCNASGGFGWGVRFDDWYIVNTSGATNNDFLGDMRVYSISPSAAGNSTGLTPSTGSNWSNVNDVPFSSTTYNGSSTPGTKDTYTYADVAASGTVRGVMVQSYAAKSDAGAVSGRNVCRSGGADFVGADTSLSTSYQMFSTLWENDPATSAPWASVAAVNAAEFGWEVRP